MTSVDKKLISKLTKRLTETEKIILLQKKKIEDYKKQLEELMKEKTEKKEVNFEKDILNKMKKFFLTKNTSSKTELILNKEDLLYIVQTLNLREKENDQPKSGGEKIPKINFFEIARKIEKMNEKLKKEGKPLKKHNNIISFDSLKKLPLLFYKNGIKLGKYPFKSYKNEECVEIVIDLLEGFYPKIMEDNFPEGAFLEIQDLMNVNYDNNKKISKEEFLQKMPKQYISKGNIVNVRDNIKKQFEKIEKKNKESSMEKKLKEDNCDNFFDNLKKTFDQSKFILNNQKEENDCKLKIRNEKGKNYFFELNSQCSLENLYLRLEEIFKKKFVLETNYPRKSLDRKTEKNKTMVELDLAPQSLLLLKYL